MYPKEILEKYSNFFEIDFKRPYKKNKIKKNPNKNLVIADLHAPFHHKDLLETILNDQSDCKDIYIIGDMWDFYSKSFYRKQMSVQFPKEFREGFFLLQRFSEMFENLYLMLSNHDQRFKKWIFDNVPEDLIDFTDYNVLSNLLQTIPNLVQLSQKTISGRNVEYIAKHKNLIFTHVEKSNKDITKTVQEIEKDFARWGTYFNLGEYDGVMQAHNHSSGRVKYGDKILFQLPCLIDINSQAFNYVFNGKLIGNPPALGYVVLYENNGFDLRKTHIVDF